MNRLSEGRVAIVTGSANGLGREYSRMLAKHGAKVVVNDVGGDAAGDGEMTQRPTNTDGRLDILPINAGILRDRMFVNITEPDLDDVARVHLKGTPAPNHHACVHWRLRKEAGEKNDARTINDTHDRGEVAKL